MTINAIRQTCMNLALRLLRRLGRTRRDAGRQELLSMGERELRDLAIGRGEIPYLLTPGAQRAEKQQRAG